MRAIKFRGKDYKGNWQFGSYYYGVVYPTSYEGHYVNDWQVDQNTIGQFTGLLDKNGKEIYEGDIIKTKWNNIDKVEWVDLSCGFEPFSDSKENCGHCGGGEIPVDCEVIGNIYEHRHLLEKANG